MAGLAGVAGAAGGGGVQAGGGPDGASGGGPTGNRAYTVVHTSSDVWKASFAKAMRPAQLTHVLSKPG